MRQIAVGFSLSLLTVLIPVAAQAQAVPNVLEVRVSGLERISEQLVRSRIEVQPGEAYNPRAVARDIRRLYEMGYFAAIRADADPRADGVVITYVIEEKRVIQEIKIIGNSRVNDRRIRGVLSWREGDAFLADGYDAERQAILDLYADRGFANTQVDIVAEKVGPSRVRITYVIDEGRRARIRGIEFVGNQALSDRDLRGQMSTSRGWWIFGGRYSEDKFETDLDKIVDSYGDVGRLEADVPHAEITYSDNGKSMYITVHVSEGPEYRVESLEVADNIVYDDDEILEIIRVHAGDVHNRGQVARDADLVEKGYSDSGYVDAAVTPQVILDRDAKTTRIVHQVDEGDLQYIRQVRIAGNEVTKDEVVRRHMLLRPGDRFDGGTLQLSQRALESTQYFRMVRMSLRDVVDDPLYTDLLVDVEEGNTGTFNFGAGYSTEEGIGGFAELRLSNFDIANWPTFSGGGQQFSTRVNIGDRRDSYSISFTDPQFLGYPFMAGIDLFNESYRVSGAARFTESRKGGQLRFGKSLSPFTTTRWNLMYQDVDLSNFPLAFLLNPLLRPLTEDSKTVSIGWSIERNTTDNPLDPAAGSRHSLRTQVAGFGGDNKFFKIEHDSIWYRALGRSDDWVLSFQTREGWVRPYGGQDFVLLQDRFYAGGTGTVRGYRNRDIGPKIYTFRHPWLFGRERFAVGGELRVVQNLEVKYKLNEIFRLYGFGDMGGVWFETSDFDFGDLRYSAGLGVGVDVPRIGPVRLDYAMPINPDSTQSSRGRLHMSTGFRF